ncbi:porin [Lonsdalea populi]|uniref:Porin n=3 Tax=Lonsdalea TaxID=1082702 RepID=A0ACD1J8D6_9GAMM|nr:porin [Lonsdalea populi]RAT10808.1 porin [Lonsdalea quercina]QPQ23809.1 OmpA family protein [Lonsdalea populi]RAT15884.1 porin [Lonsdalea quercina]RAT18698.1 porin [Lonsdalea populi]
MKVKHLRKATVLAMIVSLTSSCSSMHNMGQSYGTAIGCVGGAALGGGLTYLATGDAKKAVAGGILGGIAGCALGNVWQSREKALAQIAADEKIAIHTETLKTDQSSGNDAVGIVAQVEDSAMFPTGSAALTPDGLRQVKKIAAAMKTGDGNDTGLLLVVGHTDATGSASLNQRLSEQRARNVGRVLEQSGISADRLYFQGAGSSRPIADNETDTGRAANRRVELVGLANEALLKQRLQQEGNNPRYLEHGTASTATAVAKRPSANTKTAPRREDPAVSAPSISSPPRPAKAIESKNYVDFGGDVVNASLPSLAANLKPQHRGFSLIGEAHASVVAKSCIADTVRVSGEARNLASGQSLEVHETREYLPGMNGRAWAGLVNGHLVTLSPVRVLRENVSVTEDPKVYITRNYMNNNRKADVPLKAVANAWEGEDNILYRVYIQDGQQQNLSCIDLLVDKDKPKSQQGQLFYFGDGDNKDYMAAYTPARS